MRGKFLDYLTRFLVAILKILPFIIFPVIWILGLIRCYGEEDSPKDQATDIARLIVPHPGAVRTQGIGVAILIDNSGSMTETVPTSTGSSERKPKIDIASSVIVTVVQQLQSYATEQPDRVIHIDMMSFSGNNPPPYHTDHRMRSSPPDLAIAARALGGMSLGGNTPIGDAIVDAKRTLDGGGLSKNHILVVTDGQSNIGFDPALVVAETQKLPEDQRPRIYFVAFDVAASVFEPVKKNGALVLSASNESELRAALDYLIADKILLER